MILNYAGIRYEKVSAKLGSVTLVSNALPHSIDSTKEVIINNTVEGEAEGNINDFPIFSFSSFFISYLKKTSLGSVLIFWWHGENEVFFPLNFFFHLSPTYQSFEFSRSLWTMEEDCALIKLGRLSLSLQIALSALHLIIFQAQRRARKSKNWTISHQTTTEKTLFFFFSA